MSVVGGGYAVIVIGGEGMQGGRDEDVAVVGEWKYLSFCECRICDVLSDAKDADTMTF